MGKWIVGEEKPGEKWILGKLTAGEEPEINNLNPARCGASNKHNLGWRIWE